MIYGQPLNLGLVKKSSKVDRAASILPQRADCDRLGARSSRQRYDIPIDLT
ncbi:hypothetical protein QUA27_19305 [Microcoleus sp. Pol14C6]|uniref:hypothetical protein n=1 Tax=unclassified Microcoleus TaxID=2642155 RepID=UPI002FD568CB